MSLHVPNNLSHEHTLVHARDINSRELSFHIGIYHGVSTENAKTKAQLGRLHLLAHAVQAHPELIELLGLSPGWGIH